MLARTWSGTEATAIWAELVAGRKKDIQENQDASQIHGMAAMVAAQQELSRADLAKWDSSARAWLLCADEVEKVKLTQLRLTTRDCGLHVSSLGDTYSSVIGVWTVAMKTIQDLVLGMPQRITKGAVLVGLSAWHIYPDLNIVGPIAHVKFRDELVGAGGVVTIGLQSVSQEEHRGVQWSLSLSHLRYYGDPVSLSATSGDASLRVTMRELHYFAMGSLFATWVPYVSDNTSGCEFLLALRDAVKGSKELDLAWLQLLWDASQQFLNLSKPLEKDNASSLMALGRRKGHIFFGWQEESLTPLLGLNNPIIWDWLSWTTLPRVDNVFDHILRYIEFFRAMAERQNLRSDQYVIRYCLNDDSPMYRGRPLSGSASGNRPGWYRYTTVHPIQISGPKRDRYGRHLVDQKHCHWAPVSSPSFLWDERIRQLGEHMVYLNLETDICLPGGLHDGFCFAWSRPPKAFHGNAVVIDSRQDLLAHLAYSSLQKSVEDSLKFSYVAGRPQEIALFRVWGNRREDSSEQALIKGTLAKSFLRSGKADSERLVEYFNPYQVAEEGSSTQPFFEKHISHVTDSISSLAQATALYDQLPGATVSISVLNVSLREAKWRRDCHGQQRTMLEWLSRSERFACIAMFESGNLNLNPDSIESVMAMSSGNSIFTLSALLQDPSLLASSSDEVTRILGNLNRPGIAVLVPPMAPLIRKCDPSAWRVIAHTPFDGEPKDSFTHTSLHLSFTPYEMPLIVRTGTVDAEVTVIESLVSVYDRQKWTGDIDVVKVEPAFDFESIDGTLTFSRGVRYLLELPCRHVPSSSTLSSETFIKRIGTAHSRQLISIDSWDELLDPPEKLGSQNIGVLRAVGNWQAKLAAFTICIQLGYRTFLKHANECGECLFEYDSLKHMQIYIL